MQLAGNISDDFREAHTEIPWRQFGGLRNIYAHNYQDVDYDHPLKFIFILYFLAPLGTLFTISQSSLFTIPIYNLEPRKQTFLYLNE